MTYSFELATTFAATPEEIYDAWLSSVAHSAMTGGRAEVQPSVGGSHSAWDGYIWGKTVALDEHRRIVQTWRTSDFAEDDGDSLVEITLEPVEEGTRFTLKHSQVPTDDRSYEKGGWEDNYFAPMRRYFAK